MVKTSGRSTRGAARLGVASVLPALLLLLPGSARGASAIDELEADLAARRMAIERDRRALNAECGSVSSGDAAKVAGCRRRQGDVLRRMDGYRADVQRLNRLRQEAGGARTASERSRQRARALMEARDGDRPDAPGFVRRATAASVLPASGGGARPLLEAAGPRLEPGDEVHTGPGGGAELDLLGGRGAVTAGESSRLRVEKGPDGGEAVRLIEGKVHVAVEKVAAYEAALEREAAALAQRMKQLPGDYERFIRGLRARARAKLEIRTRGGTASVRGTELLVTAGPDGRVEIAVLEGSVAVRGFAGGEEVPVEAGRRLSIGPDGRLSGAQPVDPAPVPRWWEERP